MPNLEDLKRQLKHEGLGDLEHIQDFYLANKHISRHLVSLRFIDSKGLKKSSLVLTKLYRADVVMRQELIKVLMPIELSITSKVLYWLEDNNITKGQLEDGSVFEPTDHLNRYVKWRRLENNKFISESVEKIGEKWRIRDLKDIITQMTFGQIAALINALPERCSKSIFGGAEKTTSSKVLNDIVNIRNYIAHLGQLFTIHGIKVTPHIAITLSALVLSIAEIAYGNYSKDLERSFTRYQDNTLNQIDEADPEKSDIIDLFSVLHNELFGV